MKIRTFGGVLAAVAMLGVAACNSDPTNVTGTSSSTNRPISSPATSPSAAADRTASTLTWAPCAEAGLEGGECATVEVPLDYQQPDGPTIDIALFRVRSTLPKAGSILTNPGGPGGSGIEFVRDSAFIFPDEFDVIGFDPRGVGRSHPIDCVTDAEHDSARQHPMPVTDPVELQSWLDELADHATRCIATELAPHVGTVNVARDLDLIRVALGDDTINYVGFSYGAQIGWTYAQLFPDRIRAMVLDAPADPLANTATLQLQQAEGIAGQLAAFAAWCADVQTVTCPADPLDAIDTIWSNAAKEPLPTTPSPHPPLSAPIAFLGVVSALYTDARWPSLATALNSGLNGDGLALFDLAASAIDRLPNDRYRDPSDARDIIWCADHPDRQTLDDVEQVTADIAKISPLLAERFPGPIPWCWAYPPATEPLPVPSSPDIPPILVVSSTGDPVTPPIGARHLVEILGDAVLLTRDGPGHTSYGQTRCTDQTIDRYLIGLKLPPPDTICPNA